MKAWLEAEAESYVKRAQNRRTRVVSCLLLERRRSEYQGSTAILNKHKGAWLGPATVLGDGSEPRATRRGSWHSLDRGAGSTFAMCT